MKMFILKTIFLRQQFKIKIPDAIIASTALVYNLSLVSHNNKDFKGIPGLTVIDPIVYKNRIQTLFQITFLHTYHLFLLI